MSGEVPEGWSVKPLGEIADLIMGQSPPSSAVAETGDGLPFIQGNAEFGARHPTPRFVASTTPKVVRGGDVLISVRAPVGEVNIAEGPLCIGRGVGGIRAKDCDPDFLFYAVGGLSQTFARLSQGSTFDAINGKELRSIEILVPRLDEQRRIAEVLRSLDDVTQAADRVSRSLAAAEQVMIDDLCFRSPEGEWRRVELGELLEDVRYGTSAKCEADEISGLPVLRIPNVLGGRINFNDLKFATLPEAEQRRLALRQGDIVVVRTNGNPSYVGRSAIVRQAEGTLLYASYLIRLRLNPELAWAPFIDAALKSSKVREALLRSATTSAGNYNINSESLRRLTMPLPPLAEQRRISDVLDATGAASDISFSSHFASKEMARLVASDLLSGRVRVPA